MTGSHEVIAGPHESSEVQPDLYHAGLEAGLVAPARKAGGRRFLTWAFVPNIATLAGITALFCSLFFLHGYERFFGDSNTGLHIRDGESILTTGHLPHVDPFSFTFPNRPWFAWEWLAEVVMGAVHQAAGLSGIALLFGIAIGICAWLWVRLSWAVGGSFLMACLIVRPMLYAIGIHLLARPHVLSWMLLLFCVLFFEKLDHPLRWKDAAVIFLIVLLWANTHASFFLAPLIGGAYAIGRLFARWTWRDMPQTYPGASAKATLVAIVATFINPYSWHLYEHIFAFLRDRTMFDAISEYQSFNFHQPGSWFFTVVVLIVAIGGTAAIARKKLPHAILSFLFLVEGLTAVRMIPLLVLIALPFSNGAITSVLRLAPGLQARLQRVLNSFFRFEEEIRTFELRTNGWLTAIVAVVIAMVLLRTPTIVAQTGFSPREFPVQAANVIARLPLDSRIFSTDMYGGYLIYRFAGKRRVYFDGRGDFYGGEFFRDYGRMVTMGPGWQELWNSQNFTHALIERGSPIILPLEQMGWRRIYRDEVAVILAAPASDTHIDHGTH